MAMVPQRLYLLHRRFDDFDHFAEVVRGWNLDFRQLDAGPFSGKLLQCVTDSAQFAHARFGRALDQRGAPPEGLRTLVVPANARQHFVWRGREISGTDMLVFPEGGELQSASRPGFEVFTISLPESVLAARAAELELPDSATLFRRNEVVCCAPRAMTVLRRILRRIGRRLATEPGPRSGVAVPSDLGEILAEHLLSTLAQGRVEASVDLPEPRRHVLDAADEFIRASSEEPLEVGQLCRAIGVSERTLRRAFRDRFGMPPKPYLQALRLNAVRRELRRGDLVTTKVADVANRWGFWHMGQFAADYRRLFGELPSATLRKRCAAGYGQQ